MRYSFPVFAKGQHRPIKLNGDCEACQVYERVSLSSMPDQFLWDNWVLHAPQSFQNDFALTAMMKAAEQVDDDVDVIVPWTKDRFPHTPGSNDAEMAARVFVHDGEPYIVPSLAVAPPVCLQRAVSKPLCTAKTVRVPNAWVAYDGCEERPYDPIEPLAREVASYLKPTQRQVVFVFREFPVCGVTLAATHICNGLNRLGWNATIACTQLDPAQAKLFPFEFGPMVFKGLDELVRVLGERTDKTSVVIAPVHAMVATAAKVSASSGADLVYYVQDDERRFRQVRGEPYYKAEKIEAGWVQVAKQGRLVANSHWVASMLERAGHETSFVPIGVDTDTFKSGDRTKPPFRIMAHCRPSTPRRGWGFIAAVFNQLAIRGLDFEAVVYDEFPLGLQVKQYRALGRLSPQQVACEMGQAHVFIEGSDVQGFGMQALEAMASGCVLVCTANRGIDTFGNHGVDCVVVQYGDVAVAANEIIELATDLELRTSFGQNARARAEEFEWREVCEVWDRVLRCERSVVDDEANP